MYGWENYRYLHNLWYVCPLYIAGRLKVFWEMHDNLCNPKEVVKIMQQKLKGLIKLQWSVRSKLFYHILDFIFQRFKIKYVNKEWSDNKY